MRCGQDRGPGVKTSLARHPIQGGSGHRPSTTLPVRTRADGGLEALCRSVYMCGGQKIRRMLLLRGGTARLPPFPSNPSPKINSTSGEKQSNIQGISSEYPSEIRLGLTGGLRWSFARPSIQTEYTIGGRAAGLLDRIDPIAFIDLTDPINLVDVIAFMYLIRLVVLVDFICLIRSFHCPRILCNMPKRANSTKI